MKRERFTFNLFRSGKMVQIGMHYLTGTFKDALGEAHALVVSEKLDKVSIEDSTGLIRRVIYA